MVGLNRPGESRRRAALRVAAVAVLAASSAAHAWDDVTEPSPGPAESIGRYAAGCLAGGVSLAADGPGFQTIRLSRNRTYGHPELVRFIEVLAERAANAGLGVLTIGDLSQPRGGPMIAAHASHQVGLDVDIYFKLDLPRLEPREREDLDLPVFVDRGSQRINAGFGERQAALLQLAANDPRVARIFVHPAIKLALCERDGTDRRFLATLRPWFGHDDHMHVRLRCPRDSAACVDQAPPPPGDGCGAELSSWLERGPLPARPPGPRREPALPPRCEALR